MRPCKHGRVPAPLLSDHDLAGVVAAVEAEQRDVDLRGARLHDHGWENIVLETADGWILRFPRNESVAFEREIAVLRRLSGRLPVPSPQIAWIGHHTRFAAYRALTGATYSEAEYGGASERDRDLMTGSWAEFLAGMHVSLDPAEILELDVPSNALDQALMVAQVREGLGWLPSELRPTAAALADELAAASTVADAEVLLHNDFHEGNLVLDRPLGRIAGIWDFSCVQTGGASFDFRYLDGTSKDLLARVAGHYTTITGRHVDQRAAAVANRVENLADAIQTDDRGLLATAVMRWARVDAGL